MIEQNLIKFCDKEFENKDALIQYLGEFLYEQGKITDMDEYIHAVQHRENLISTEIGSLMAIPHGESSSVKESFVAILRLKSPLQWDEEKVQYVFNLGIPLENRAVDQIRALAALSSHLMLSDFREKIYQTQNENELFDVLKTIQIKEEE